MSRRDPSTLVLAAMTRAFVANPFGFILAIGIILTGLATLRKLHQ